MMNADEYRNSLKKRTAIKNKGVSGLDNKNSESEKEMLMREPKKKSGDKRNEEDKTVKHKRHEIPKEHVGGEMASKISASVRNGERVNSERQDEAPRHKKQDEALRHRKQNETPRHKKQDEESRHRKPDETPRYKKQDEESRHRKPDETPRHKKQDEESRHRKPDETLRHKKQDEIMKSKKPKRSNEVVRPKKSNEVTEPVGQNGVTAFEKSNEIAEVNKPRTNNSIDGKKTNMVNETPLIDDDSRKIIHILILAIEVVVLIIIVCVIVNLRRKITNKDFDLTASGVEALTEEAKENSQDAKAVDEGTDNLENDVLDTDDMSTTQEEVLLEDDTADPVANSVSVDNENFSLTCSNVEVTIDTNGEPMALIYFMYSNKTETPLSMSEVFPPSVTQGGEMCETYASMETYPDEFYNKDTQISGGKSLSCCYAVSLKDAITPIMLTVHDNYESFSDIGTEEIKIQ